MNKSQKLFDLSLIIYVLYNVIFVMSYISEVITIPESSGKLISILCIILVLYKLIIQKYTRKELIVAFVLLIVGVIVTYKTRDDSILVFCVYCVASKNIDLLITFKKLFKLMFFTLLVIICLAIIGFIPNIREYSDLIWYNRIYCGFKHPNYCGAILLNLFLLKFVLNKGTVSRKNIFSYVILFLINLLGPKTKTCLILMIFVFIFIIINKLSSRRFMRYLIESIKILPVVVVIGFAYILNPFFNINNISIIYRYPSLYDRFEQMLYYFNKYGITLWGQVLENVSYKDVTNANMVHTLDNGFMYLLLGQGLVFFVIYVLILIKCIKNSVFEKEYYLTFIYALIIIWGMLETYIYRINIAPIILILFIPLYKRNPEKGEKKICQKKHLSVD